MEHENLETHISREVDTRWITSSWSTYVVRGRGRGTSSGRSVTASVYLRGGKIRCELTFTDLTQHTIIRRALSVRGDDIINNRARDGCSTKLGCTCNIVLASGSSSRAGSTTMGSSTKKIASMYVRSLSRQRDANDFRGRFVASSRNAIHYNGVSNRRASGWIGR